MQYGGIVLGRSLVLVLWDGEYKSHSKSLVWSCRTSRGFFKVLWQSLQMAANSFKTLLPLLICRGSVLSALKLCSFLFRMLSIGYLFICQSDSSTSASKGSLSVTQLSLFLLSLSSFQPLFLSDWLIFLRDGCTLLLPDTFSCEFQYSSFSTFVSSSLFYFLREDITFLEESSWVESQLTMFSSLEILETRSWGSLGLGSWKRGGEGVSAMQLVTSSRTDLFFLICYSRSLGLNIGIITNPNYQGTQLYPRQPHPRCPGQPCSGLLMWLWSARSG